LNQVLHFGRGPCLFYELVLMKERGDAKVLKWSEIVLQEREI